MADSLNYITGYYGCSCHPFSSWEECDFYHKQKLNVGDKVLNRHTSESGEVDEIHSKGFVNVKYGERPCDIHQEHVAKLIKIQPQRMKLHVGQLVKTNYGRIIYRIIEINRGCICPEYHDLINGVNKPSEEHCHIVCKDAKGFDREPFYLNGYREDGTSVWNSDDRIIIISSNNVQLSLF
jgi:hypothetical protein